MARFEEKPVSSPRIRTALEGGDVPAANAMLGMLHTQACDQGMLILGGEQTAALHFAVSGQLEGEHRRGSAVGLCPLHCSLNDGTVADVDAIEVAHGNSSAALMFQRQRRQR